MSRIMIEKKMKKVSANLDVEVKEIVEERIENAIQEVINTCSKEFFRNVDVSFSVKVN